MPSAPALLVAVVAATAIIPGCGSDPVAELLASVDDEANLGQLHADLEFLDPSEWLDLYRPEKAWSGYNLVLYRRRMPILIDMNGRLVHAWPKVRASGRVRLDRHGRLAVIGTDDLVKEYDWDGRLIWAYRLPGEDHLPHHDLIQLGNGNYLVLGRIKTGRVDYLHEVDRRGRLVWEWIADDRVTEAVPGAVIDTSDRTHINSVQELPPNRWFDAGDERFRPGNILLSARNLNAIMILDRASGEVIWRYDRRLDYQHEAIMVPAGFVGEGLIAVFDNGYHNRLAYRRSRIVAVDPVAEAEVWSYQSPAFFSSVAGSQQPLPNGNVLITSSEGGRVFEVTIRGEVVWQWIPPFEPMRAARVAYDHCPQLERLARPAERFVDRDDRPPWIDLELGQFTLPEEHSVREVYGQRRKLLPGPHGCRQLVLPAEPVLHFGYGFDPKRLAEAPGSARFTVTLGAESFSMVRRLHDDRLDPGDGRPWRNHRIPLEGLDGRRVELCVHADFDPPVEGAWPRGFVLWENPTARSAAWSRVHREWREMRHRQHEKSLVERQLEAIGYVQ